MRLRDIKDTLDRVSRILKSPALEIRNDNKNRRHENLENVRNAIRDLEKTGILIDQVKRIKEIEAVFLNTKDVTVLSGKHSSLLGNSLRMIQERSSAISEAISELLPKQTDLTLCLKLPKIVDLKGLIEVSRELDFIFDQLLVNDFVNGEAKVQNFDTGSEWIEIVLSTTQSLSVIVGIVYSAVYLQNLKLKNQQQEQTLKMMKLTSSNMEAVSQNLVENLQNEKKAQIEQISKIAGCPETENEYTGRISESIDRLTKLIEMGLKVFPASTPTKETSARLPDFSKKALDDMLGGIKLLGECSPELTEEQHGDINTIEEVGEESQESN